MKITIRLVLAVAGLAALAVPYAAAARDASEPQPSRRPAGVGYALAADIVPDLGTAGAYEARVVVTDLETGRVISAPRVRFLRGRSGRGQIRTGTSDGLQVNIQVEVGEAGETAVYQAEIWRGGLLLQAHRVRVRLAGGEAAE